MGLACLQKSSLASKKLMPSLAVLATLGRPTILASAWQSKQFYTINHANEIVLYFNLHNSSDLNRLFQGSN